MSLNSESVKLPLATSGVPETKPSSVSVPMSKGAERSGKKVPAKPATQSLPDGLGPDARMMPGSAEAMATISRPEASAEKLSRRPESGVPFGSTEKVIAVWVGVSAIEEVEKFRMGAADAARASPSESEHTAKKRTFRMVSPCPIPSGHRTLALSRNSHPKHRFKSV